VSLNPPLPNTGQSDLREKLVDGPFEEGAYVRIYCPFHPDTTTPSGAVYDGHFYCFTCAKWVGRHKFLRLLSQTSGIHAVSVVSRGASNVGVVSDALAEGYANILWGPRRERISWLLERGLDERTIREAGIGHTGSKFSIPIYVRSDGPGTTLAAIKYRLDPKYDTCADECHCPKYTNSSGSTASLYIPRGIQPGVGGWVLCEGELDALRLYREGIAACSLTSGAGSGYEVLAPLRGQSIVVAYDMDGAGGRGALRVRDYLRPDARIVTWHVERDDKGKVLPGWPKDVTDYIKMHGIEKFRRLARI
jgi:DNA primase